jgi:hypothetical protein
MMDGEKWFSKDGWDNDDFENGLGEPDFTEYIGLGALEEESCWGGWMISRCIQI